MQLDPFLTAYDPTDLPAGSVDPLGFDRAYAWLADKILPGLTNVASQPRYLSVLCTSIFLADEHLPAASPRERERQRREAALRVERYWALGCLRAARASGADTTAVRGINYVKAAAAKIDASGDRSTRADYRLLSRQATYGMVGIYTTVARNLRLLRDDGFALGTELGPRLAQGFIEATGLDEALAKNMVRGDEVSLKRLDTWTQGAAVGATTGTAERKVLGEALTARDVRRRMVALLAKHPVREDEEEPRHLARVLGALAATEHDLDLREALRAIVAFEAAYREVVASFLRLVWQCQAVPPFAVALHDIEKDALIEGSRQRLAVASRDLEASFEASRTPAFREGLERVRDVRTFLRVAASTRHPGEFALAIVRRHGEVQRAKVFRGQPKMPWLEVRDAAVVPTLAAAQRVDRAPTRGDDVPSHPYRTWAACQIARAGGVA